MHGPRCEQGTTTQRDRSRPHLGHIREALRASTLSPPSGDSERADTAGEDGGEYTGGAIATGAGAPPRALALA